MCYRVLSCFFKRVIMSLSIVICCFVTVAKITNKTKRASRTMGAALLATWARVLLLRAVTVLCDCSMFYVFNLFLMHFKYGFKCSG